MKIKGILFVAVYLATIMSAKAQTGAASGTQYGLGQDSINCITNIFLYQNDFKANNYKDAYPRWKAAYEECPAARRDLYMQGAIMLKAFIAEEQDPAKRDALFEDLMALYDKRVTYFGDDPRYGVDYIVGAKATDYIAMKGDNIDPQLLYGWLDEVIKDYQASIDPKLLSYLMFASYKLIGVDINRYRDQYINDFQRCSALLDTQLENANAANDTTAMTNAAAYKAQILEQFTSSGIADCETMESVFASKIEANKTDIDFLKQTITLFRRVGCVENVSYFLASNYAHRLDPTAESAQGLGRQAYIKEDYATAEKYFTEAASLTSDNDIKGNMYYLIANMALGQKNYQKARQFAIRSLDANPNYGRAYLIIGQAYAQTASSVYPNDTELRKCVYCLAVDKFERARQVDPSVASEANTLISTYRSYFPTTEEIFMHPDLTPGAQITIGGWINERTTVRARN